MSYIGAVKTVIPGGLFNGAWQIYQLKETLKTAGWTVERSGDGLALFSDSGDIITSPDTGAGGMDNPFAWIVLQQPTGGSAPHAGTRQIVLQRENSGADFGDGWLIGYSPATGYGSGSGTSTQIPTLPADHQFALGGGTPASPTFNTLFLANSGASKMHLRVGDASENFSFLMCAQLDAAADIDNHFFFDGLDQTLPGEADPFLILGRVGNFLSGSHNNHNSAVGYMDLGGGGEGWVQMGMQTMADVPELMPQEVISGKDGLYPVAYTRDSSQADPKGYKGVSHLFRWPGVNRNHKDTYTRDTTKDLILFDQLVAPWDGTDGPV